MSVAKCWEEDFLSDLVTPGPQALLDLGAGLLPVWASQALLGFSYSNILFQSNM